MKKLSPLVLFALALLLGTELSKAANPPIRIWAVGDSITEGCCSGTTIEGGFRTELYTRLINAGYTVDYLGTLADANPPSGLPDPDHEGHGGYRIDEIESGVESWLSVIDDPDVILLLIGTNDYGQNHDTSHAINRLETLVAHLATSRPFAKIIVANLVLRTDFPAVETSIQNTFNPFVPGVVNNQVALGRQVYFVDLHSVCGPADLAEGLHPNPAGYSKLGDAWFTAVSAIIGPTGTPNPPAILRVKGQVDLRHIDVTFSKPVADSAANLGNYGLSGGVSISQASLDSSKRVVTLTTGLQAPATSYTLSVSGVVDRTPQQHPIAVGTTATFTSGPVAEAGNYSLVYSLRIPNHADFNANGVPYEVDNHGSIGSFSRVAYYLELQTIGGSLQYVWASMNAFTSDASKIGVPTIQSGAFFQQTVASLNVRSSVPGVVTGDGMSGGNLEFWWGNYGPNNDANVPGASSALYDWGDSASASDPAGYGSMQVNNSTASQTIFAFNDWGYDTDVTEMGIGNYSGQNPDWTFAQNGSDYSYKRLQVYVLPGGGSPGAPVITKQPSHLTGQVGTSASFSVTATSQLTISYQWRFNGNAINGATASTYTIANVQAGNAGTYDVVVSNTAGPVTSAPAVLSIATSGNLANGSFESDYAAWSATGNQGIGSEAPYQASAGSKSVVFNWGQSTPNGVLSQTFVTTAGQSYTLAFDQGILAFNQNEQRVQVTVQGSATLLSQTLSVFGTVNGSVVWTARSFTFVADSGTTTLTFRDVSPTTVNLDMLIDNVRVNSQNGPVITTQPASQTVVVNSSVTFTVAATGPSLTYQWRFNGNPISGAVGTSYTIASVQIGNAGNYDVVVSNAGGPVTSSTAVLTVVQAGGLVNGSFESDYTGWTASGNQGIGSGSPYLATDGVKDVVFNWGNSVPNGVLAQTFSTTSGQTYTLAFDAGAFGSNQNEQRLQVTVQGSSSLLSQTVSIFAPGNSTVRWLPQSFNFVANSATTTLTFRDVSPSTTSLDLLLDNVRVTGQGQPTVRTLTVNSSNPASGVAVTVSPADNNTQSSGTTAFTRSYNDGAVVNLIAPATAGGNNFQKWQRDNVDFSTSANVSVTMDANRTMTAVYVTPPTVRTLTVNSSNPASGVSITVSPADNNTQSSGTTAFTRSYNNGVVVNLIAPATAGGNNFQKWQRDNVDFSTSANVSVTMDANRTMTAVYVTPPTVRTLTVNSSNPASGVAVTVSPADNNTQSSGTTAFTRSYNNGAVVNLIAPATAGGNNFQKWQRDNVDFSTSANVNVTMDANRTMTAVYVTPPTVRTLTVNSSNPASGVAVTVSPADNNTQSSGTTAFTRSYNNGVVVNLIAPATAGGNNFQKWQRDNVDFSTSANVSVTMDANRTMTAVYVTPPTVRTLTVNSSNPASGVSITVSPADNNTQSSGTTAFTRSYNNGVVVNLIASATAGGNNFQKWQRDNVDFSTSANVSVTMDANRTMTAVYVTPPVVRVLTVNSSNPASGVAITVSPADNNTQGNGTTAFTRSYNNGSVVNLIAPATAGGNNFQKWQRDNVDFSTSANVSVTMDANRTMTAVYVTPVVRVLTVRSSNPNSGLAVTVSPSDRNNQGNGTTTFTRSYLDGTVVTLTAPLTASGRTFQKWQQNGVDFSTSRSVNITVNANTTLTAIYVTTRTLTVRSSNANGNVAITISPADNNNQSNGTTTFTRSYADDTVVTLTAPATANGRNFVRWQRDGFNFTTSRTATLTLDANRTMTAVYTR